MQGGSLIFVAKGRKTLTLTVQQCLYSSLKNGNNIRDLYVCYPWLDPPFKMKVLGTFLAHFLMNLNINVWLPFKYSCPLKTKAYIFAVQPGFWKNAAQWSVVRSVCKQWGHLYFSGHNFFSLHLLSFFFKMSDAKWVQLSFPSPPLHSYINPKNIYQTSI